ncbi:8404_t:CDS:2, partial [Cetraspora pellucida]
PDYVCARDWKKERKAKPVDGIEVYIHQVMNSSVIRIDLSTLVEIQSSEEDHLSDQDYTEKPKRERNLWSKLSPSILQKLQIDIISNFFASPTVCIIVALNGGPDTS